MRATSFPVSASLNDGKIERYAFDAPSPSFAAKASTLRIQRVGTERFGVFGERQFLHRRAPELTDRPQQQVAMDLMIVLELDGDRQDGLFEQTGLRAERFAPG
jgi:hypothetical protein